MHLPLSPLDAHNDPSDLYLAVQDGLTLGCGILWGTAYFLYIRQAIRDETYGMPLFALWCNIGWETVYGLIDPPAVAEFIAFLPFLMIDMGIVYTTVKFGPREWKQAPLIAQNIGMINAIGILMMLGGHWTFKKMFLDLCEGGFWAGFICQGIISWSSIAQLLSRSSIRGHSMQIWCLRFSGTLIAILVFQWRYYHYPESYKYVRTPAATFLFISTELAEIAYVILYCCVKRLERKKH